MREIVMDIEGDSLTPKKLHVISYQIDNHPIKSRVTRADMDKTLLMLDWNSVWIGHNFICFDKPVMERLFNRSYRSFVIDTLALSWYLYPTRMKHGLEDWGEYFGFPKVKVDDWVNGPKELYVERCETDVIINKMLWDKIKADLLELYDGDWDECMRLIRYLMFKMRCAMLQERSKWKLDVAKAQKHLAELEKEREDKLPDLIAAMPKVKKYVWKKRPAAPFKKDGSVSVAGAKWFNLLKERGLPKDHMGEVQVLHSEEEPNPGSHAQLKEWLFSLGWKPIHFKFVRDKDTGNVRKIPQLKDESDDSALCPSVLDLVGDNPAIGHLAGMGIINHRITVFRGMLDEQREGYLYAGIGGLTNTLRFKHRKPLTNLPGVGAPWGKEIRGCLVARVGMELIGSDQSSLEDRTKLHYMHEYDPDYVKEMSTPGFDPHLDLAMQAGELTANQVEEHKQGLANYTAIRQTYKTANYACVYGASGETVARGAKVPVAKGVQIVEAYWKRNWAVKAIARDAITKKIGNQMWLFNPVSKFWYSLRHEKDIFSTLNQGTGVYAFDTWVKYVLQERPQLTGQFHDEIIIEVPVGHRDIYEKILRDALDKTNKQLMLNRQLDIDVQFGDNYAQIH